MSASRLEAHNVVRSVDPAGNCRCRRCSSCHCQHLLPVGMDFALTNDSLYVPVLAMYKSCAMQAVRGEIVPLVVPPAALQNIMRQSINS